MSGAILRIAQLVMSGAPLITSGAILRIAPLMKGYRGSLKNRAAHERLRRIIVVLGNIWMMTTPHPSHPSGWMEREVRI